MSPAGLSTDTSDHRRSIAPPERPLLSTEKTIAGNHGLSNHVRCAFAVQMGTAGTNTDCIGVGGLSCFIGSMKAGTFAASERHGDRKVPAKSGIWANWACCADKCRRMDAASGSTTQQGASRCASGPPIGKGGPGKANRQLWHLPNPSSRTPYCLELVPDNSLGLASNQRIKHSPAGNAGIAS